MTGWCWNSKLEIITTYHLSDVQKRMLLHLWNSEYPVQIAHAGIAQLEGYLAGLEDATHFFLTDEAGKTVVWAATFSRDGERWFAIITGRDRQGKGYGAKMLQWLKEKEPILNGWVTDHERYCKQDGTAYPSPVGFYIKQGFTVTGIRLETEQLSAVKIVWQR